MCGLLPGESMPATVYHLNRKGQVVRHVAVERTGHEFTPDEMAEFLCQAPNDYPDDCIMCGRFLPLVGGLLCLGCTRGTLRKAR